jgi:CubicO group peptidase (beta-lactamase class C family)
MIRQSIAAMVAVGLTVTPVAAQRAPQGPLAGFDQYLQEALTTLKGVGLAIAIVKDDSVVYAKGFGVKKQGDPAPVTPRTVFAVGSTTKAFTTAALGMLVDEGRFGWDTRATDLLRGFEVHDPAVTRELTVRDLVTHRSGLSRGDRLWMGSYFSRAEVIRRVRFLKPSWGVRTTFGYQNIMYLAAGEIIPATTRMSWDSFLHTRIFQPLGMTSTSTTTRGLERAVDVATPHATIDGQLVPIEYRRIDNIGPAGSINSNVLDMAQWIRFHLNGGSVRGVPLLAPATHREMFTTQMWLRPEGELALLYPGANFLGYGLGWFLYDYAGRKAVEHSGGIDGMITELIMIPSERLGVITLSNAGNSLVAFFAARAAINRYLGVKDDPVAQGLPIVQMIEQAAAKAEDSITRARVAGKGPSSALEGYTGIYDNPMYGPARVTLANGQLVVGIDGQDGPLDLAHWHYDTFRGAWRDKRLGKAFVTFRTSVAGRVEGLTVDGLEQEFVRRVPAALASGCDPSDPDRSRLANRASPYDSTAIRIGTTTAMVCYSRPAMRGRSIFGSALVPFDSLWRTGANDPTIIHLPVALEIAGLKLDPGHYSFYAVPGRDRWQVVLNRSITQGGLTRDEGEFKNDYTEAVRAQEVGRAPVGIEPLTEPVERFTIRSVATGPATGELWLEWEKTRARVPIRVP